MKVAIIDGYVDEPSCLGVPPYISPYPRLLAGAAASLGHTWVYLTIDEARAAGIVHGMATLPNMSSFELTKDKAREFYTCDIMAVTGGATVPGKYLRGMPMSLNELDELACNFKGEKMLGGPLARFCYDDLGPIKKKFDYVARDDADASLYDRLICGNWIERHRILEEEERWGCHGAEVIQHHPDYPRPLIVELALYRGCVRYLSGGCGYCTDILYGKPVFREPESVIREAAVLAEKGAVAFRLGGASCIFCYGTDELGRREMPRPKPEMVKKVLTGIRDVAPNLEVLHTDNANPAIIATHMNESREILKLIVQHCTGGNVLSLGLESADSLVARENNLNATPEQTLRAIRLINEIGNKPSPTGLPALLPGLNFVCGLKGETKDTYEFNFAFLKKLFNEGLMLRRINIRQVLSFRHKYPPIKHKGDFLEFKEKVRKEIDHPMLLKLIPPGSILKGVFPEVTIGKLTFGRQRGTYPIVVAIPGVRAGGPPLDVAIIAHGDRSLTAFPAPVKLNQIPLSSLSLMEGIGKKRATRLVLKRPFKRYEDAVAALDDPKLLAPYKDVLSFD